MQNFKTLNLAIDLFKCCQRLKLESYLQEQLNRASSSVALNLAEGSGKRTLKDQRKFYDIAMGSLRETQTILAMTQFEVALAKKLADVTAAHLYNLLKKYQGP